MVHQVCRDFIGYGANPPDPKGPDGARLAVNFVLNYEEGSEYDSRVGCWRINRLFRERDREALAQDAPLSGQGAE